MRIAVLLLITACVRSDPSTDVAISFGESTELFSPGPIKGDYISMQVVRTCFGPKYNGIENFTITDNILTVDRELTAVETSFVVIVPEEQKLYEIVEIKSPTEFVLASIDPLAVFTKIKLDSRQITDPNNFEGFVNIEVFGLSFITCEYDVYTQDDTSFTYNSVNSTIVPKRTEHIFTLSVDVLGYKMGLTIDMNREVNITELGKNLTGEIVYKRNFYHETHMAGVACSSDINASEYVTANSFPKPANITYTDLRSTYGTASCNVVFHTEVVFGFFIGNDVGKLVAMTDYKWSNDFSFSGRNNYINYLMTMTCSKYVTDFAINNRLMWPEYHVGERTVSLDHVDERSEFLYSEEAFEPQTNEIHDGETKTIMYPKVLKSNKGNKLTIRFDAMVDGTIVDVLMLEPMTFDGSEQDQPRTLMLEGSPARYVFKTFIRDMDALTGKYVDQTFTAGQQKATIYEPLYDLTIDIEFYQASRIGTGEFYQNSEKTIDYVYFEPVELGDGYAVMKRDNNRYVANSVDDKFQHEAIVSKRDRTTFWNDMAFDLTFENILLDSNISKLSLSFYIQEGHVKVQTLYENTFTNLSAIDAFDRIMFQMNESCCLTIYAFIQRMDGEDEEALFKYSYKQMYEKIDKSLECELVNGLVVLNVDRKQLEPVLPIKQLGKFAIVPVFSSDQIVFKRNNGYAIHQRVYQSVSKVDVWPNLRAIMKDVNLTILSQCFVTDGNALVLPLIPNVNVRNGQSSVTQNIPVFAEVAGVYSCVATMMFAIDDKIGMFCRKTDDVTGNSSFYLGCMQYKAKGNLTVWKPTKLDYSQKVYEVGSYMSVSTIRINSKTTEKIYCALEPKYDFTKVSTSFQANLNDTRFNSFTIKCDRCKQLTYKGVYKDPDVGTDNIWTFDKSILPTTLYTTCKKEEDPYCLTSKTFTELTLAEYDQNWGIETYSDGVSLESGVNSQVLTEGKVTYAKKWNGTIREIGISSYHNLSIEIELTRDATVRLRAYTNGKRDLIERLPFSAVNAFNDPLKFMKELGLGFGTLNTDGSVSGSANLYTQPELGIFEIRNYTSMDLDLIYGFNTSHFRFFEVRCAANSPEEDGICTPDMSTVAPTSTPSITIDPSVGPAEYVRDYTVIIASGVTGGILVIFGVTTIFLVYRRKKRSELSASEIYSQKMLEECDFSM